jgi:hypothetical protein
MTKKKTKSDNSEIISESVSIVKSPQVFISHDSRDAEIAEAFSSLLKSASIGILNSFRTSDNKGKQGIDFGLEWLPEIIRGLEESTEIVCLLTENSINRPWVLFETGIAKGLKYEKIIGLTIGIQIKETYNSPFYIFQNLEVDEDSLVKLVVELVGKIPNAQPDNETIRIQVQGFIKKIEVILKKPKSKTKDLSKIDPTAKLFEEIKIMFKELPSRIENITIDSNKRSNRGIPPDMFFELEHITRGMEPILGIKILLSPIKHELPWIYNGAIHIIEKLEKEGITPQNEREIDRFRELIRFSFRHPMMRELCDLKFIIPELEEVLMNYFFRYKNRRLKKIIRKGINYE